MTRQHYIDNLRWSIILLLIPYHAAQAWNIWSEPNYVYFEPNSVISTVIVFFSPFIMQLLFLFAGMSMRFALKRRSYGQFVLERIKRIAVPLVFGTLVFVPIMSHLADRINYGYSGSFFSHYQKFFTNVTDFTGADGAFNLGQFWFLLYLFILSFVLLGVVAIQKKLFTDREKTLPLWLIILFGLPMPLLHEILSIGGKSFCEFFWFLLIGYYVFTNDNNVEKVKKYRYVFLAIGVVSCVINVYLFLYSGAEYPVANTIAKYVAEWFMVLALIGVGKACFERNGRVCKSLTKISYPFFTYHFLFVVLFQYLFADVIKGNTVLLYFVPVILAYAATFICCYISIKIPPLCFLIGVKYNMDINAASMAERIAELWIRLFYGRRAGSRVLSVSEDNRRINSELEEGLVSGPITDQKSLKELRIGVSDVGYAGCEVIAVYNALLKLGKQKSLSELIYTTEKSGILMRKGLWGTNPYRLDRPRYHESVEIKCLNGKTIPDEPGVYIVSFWNSHSIRDGIHTICVEVPVGEDVKAYLAGKPVICVSEVKG